MAFRFVCCTLIPDVQVCCLCGPSPTLQDVEHSATQCFKNCSDILSAAIQCHPRNFPLSCQIDGGILGLLLVKIGTKYMMTRNPHHSSGKKTTSSSSHRLDILRTFFYQSVCSFLLPNEGSDNQGVETYWCSEYHKCYAVRIGENILCILLNSSIPTYSMRAIAEKTLKNLISDKQVCW